MTSVDPDVTAAIDAYGITDPAVAALMAERIDALKASGAWDAWANIYGIQTSKEPPMSEPIFVYTRAQGIADGVLVDVTTPAAAIGLRLPVALSRPLFDACVANPITFDRFGSDVAVDPASLEQAEITRLEDLLLLVFTGIIAQGGLVGSHVPVNLWVLSTGSPVRREVFVAVRPEGPAGENVMTIYFPEDD